MSESKRNIIRAWKDPQYRARLSQEELASLPSHPSGPVELDKEFLAVVSGGAQAQMPSQGWICTVSAECGGKCCISIHWPW